MAPSTIFLLLLFFISHLPIHTAANRTESELDPSRCRPFKCGSFSDVGYPFWSDAVPYYCGHPALKLNCTNPRLPTFTISSLPYLVIAFDPDDRILTIARTDIVSEQLICSSDKTLVSTNLNDVPPPNFSLTLADEAATLFYNCDDETETTQSPNEYTCLIGSSPREVLLESATMTLPNGQASGCRGSVSVPVLVRVAKDLMSGSLSGDVRTVLDVLKRGFQVKWDAWVVPCENCTASGGVCAVVGSFTCLCSDSDQTYAYPISCPVPPGASPRGPASVSPSSGTGVDS